MVNMLAVEYSSNLNIYHSGNIHFFNQEKMLKNTLIYHNLIEAITSWKNSEMISINTPNNFIM